jgi:hypothetical protein
LIEPLEGSPSGFAANAVRLLQLLIEDGEPDGCSHVRDLITDNVSQVKEKIDVHMPQTARFPSR